MKTTSKRKPVSTLLPETRSLRRLRELGWTVDMAEIRKGPFLKMDWGSFADMVAVRVDIDATAWANSYGKADGVHSTGNIPEVLFVQATGWGDVRRRERKVLATPDAYDVVWAGCRVEVWGWHKSKEDPKILHLSDLDLYNPLPYGHPDRL